MGSSTPLSVSHVMLCTASKQSCSAIRLPEYRTGSIFRRGGREIDCNKSTILFDHLRVRLLIVPHAIRVGNEDPFLLLRGLVEMSKELSKKKKKAKASHDSLTQGLSESSGFNRCLASRAHCTYDYKVCWGRKEKGGGEEGKKEGRTEGEE